MVKYVSNVSLENAIKAYIELSNHEFTFVLIQGIKSDIIDLVFRGENFVHFLGLHYLTDKRLDSKKIFNKFLRKINAGKPLNEVVEFNSFLKFDYDTSLNKSNCDVEKRLNLVIDLFNNLILAEQNTYCKKRANNQKAIWSHRNIEFDFAIELAHGNPCYNRVFFFISKDKSSINPIAYNPVSIIDDSQDYLDGHLKQSLALVERKFINLKNRLMFQKELFIKLKNVLFCVIIVL